MPTTKKESLFFGMMMCAGMVLIMTLYNLYINGLFSVITFKEGILDFAVGFVIAFCLDLLIVGPVAKKVAFKLPYDKSKKVNVIIAISTCMVVGMAFFMSFYGLLTVYLNNGLDADSFVTSYTSIFVKNIILAFPLQLIIMGPLVRYIFIKFVKENKVVKTV